MASVTVDFESNTRSAAITKLQKAQKDADVDTIEVIHSREELRIPMGNFQTVEQEKVGHRYITTIVRE